MNIVRAFLDAQTPAGRAALMAFFGALVAGLVGLVADYIGWTFLLAIAVAAVAVFVFRGWWALTVLPNRGGTGHRDS